ncbi:VIER F-box protein 1 [Actinidia rufa]|uniref:VIER F-box protein 1 n=1 Tax=Actinidia rufa TaxID=165716 RepID=A0A7J0DH57_9ERIC|nr:VIER F-box protein 1 [Actinidia rufa]
MGQTMSTTSAVPRRRDRSKHSPTTATSPMRAKADDSLLEVTDDGFSDLISNLPDECLACIFQSLGSGDRKRCSLVCRRWLVVDGQNRHRLSLNAYSDLALVIPSIFSRFDAVTKLALKCDRRFASIDDDALILISLRCRNLTRLKLRSCRELTDSGMAIFARNCKGLKKLSCGSCLFGPKGINAVLDNCSLLEELSVKRLRSITNGAAAEPIGPGVASASLKTICLKEILNGQCFGPLIIGSKNLRTLKLFRCSGDWDKLLELIAHRVTGMVEIHLERLQISDIGLSAISNCSSLEIFTPCDDGLIAVAKNCPNLQELVLTGVNPTTSSMEILGINCQNLERLALCGSDTVGDAEISCIAAKCVALKKLCIKNCPVSDHGMESLAGGCPNLVKVKVKKCRGVTCEGADWLRASRGSLVVNLDTGELEHQEASATASDSSAQENGLEMPPVAAQRGAANAASTRTGRSKSFKARLGLIAGKNLVACTFRRWSSFSGRSQST